MLRCAGAEHQEDAEDAEPGSGRRDGDRHAGGGRAGRRQEQEVDEGQDRPARYQQVLAEVACTAKPTPSCLKALSVVLACVCLRMMDGDELKGISGLMMPGNFR